MCEFCKKLEVAKNDRELATKNRRYYEGYELATGAYTALVVDCSDIGNFYIYASGEDDTARIAIFYCPVCGKKL